MSPIPTSAPRQRKKRVQKASSLPSFSDIGCERCRVYGRSYMVVGLSLILFGLANWDLLSPRNIGLVAVLFAKTGA